MIKLKAMAMICWTSDLENYYMPPMTSKVCCIRLGKRLGGVRDCDGNRATKLSQPLLEAPRKGWCNQIHGPYIFSSQIEFRILLGSTGDWQTIVHMRLDSHRYPGRGRKEKTRGYMPPYL